MIELKPVHSTHGQPYAGIFPDHAINNFTITVVALVTFCCAFYNQAVLLVDTMAMRKYEFLQIELMSIIVYMY